MRREDEGVLESLQSRVRIIIGIGISVAARAHCGGWHRLKIGPPQLVASTGRRQLEIALENGGELAYRPLVVLDVFDAGGEMAVTREANPGVLRPGAKMLQRFDVSELESGSYEGMVTVDTGAFDVFGAEFKLLAGAGSRS